MNNKLKWLIIIAIAATIGIGTVYAATVLTVPASVTVRSPATIAVNLNPVAFGDLTQGTSKNVTFRITNTGGSTSKVLTLTATGLPTGLTLTSDLPTSLTLVAADYFDATLTLTAAESAPLGTTSFDIIIDES